MRARPAQPRAAGVGREDLRARDADVEHAGDEHVEIAAGHLAREPYEGEDGDEGRAGEAEAQLEQMVVEEEVVDHCVAEGNQCHQDAESDKLPGLLQQQQLKLPAKIKRAGWSKPNERPCLASP